MLALTKSDYELDPARYPRRDEWTGTGHYLRLRLSSGEYDIVEITCLTAPSLLSWLRRHGGYNPRAENLVGLLLEYPDLLVKGGPSVDGNFVLSLRGKTPEELLSWLQGSEGWQNECAESVVGDLLGVGNLHP
ncbi:MAG: hypothetical protein AAGF24_08175 [Cyanobacteria bacterium P01_H01_bin.121]